MRADAIEDANHLRARIGEFRKARPLANNTKGLLAGLYQSTTAKTFEARIDATMRRDKLFLVPLFDAKPDDIERRHVPLPVVKERQILPTRLGRSSAVGFPSFYYLSRDLGLKLRLGNLTVVS
jgi:hypothetical protein